MRTKSYVAVIVFFMLGLVFILAPALTVAEQVASPKFSEVIDHYVRSRQAVHKERWVSKGIKHICEFRPEGPYLINVLEIDLPESHLAVEAEKGQDRLFAGEKVAQLAERESYPEHMVVAATNGDFWGDNYIPIGLFVDDGLIYKGPHPTRSVFLMDDQGIPYIGPVQLKISGKLSQSDLQFDIDAINFPQNEPQAILFNWVSGTSTGTDNSYSEIMLKILDAEFIPNKTCRGKVESIQHSQGNSPLEKGYMVLAVRGEKKQLLEENIKQGDELQLLASLDLVGQDWESPPVVLAIGGVPKLISKGKININFAAESIRESFVTDRHPRTALGYSQDRKKLFLFTVDGRQPAISIGMDLYEVARYLKALGAWEALNLDGGGSTTMWVRGEIVNRPSDRTGPRTVTNGLLLVSQTIPGAPKHLSIYPESAVIPAGSLLKFALIGYDEYYNPVPAKESEIEWYATEGLGRLEAPGQVRLTAKDMEGTVMARWAEHAIFDNVAIRVKEVAEVRVQPEKLVLTRGQSKQIMVDGLAADGQRFFLEPYMIEATGDACFSWSPQNLTISGKEQGKGILNLRIGDKQTSVPVYVDMFRSDVIEAFEQLDHRFAITGQAYDEAKTSVTLENNLKKEGKAALRLNYAMTPGGTTIISIPLNLSIPGEPEKLALWVYGDGKEHWLRGELEDKDGEQFLLDFTDGAKGIYWKDQWRWLELDHTEIIPKWTNPEARLDFPLKLLRIYLAQGRQEKKSSGSVLFDSLSAIYIKE